MRESDEHSLPAWVTETLRHPVSAAASRRSAIMERVRKEPLPRVLSAPMRASRWSRRGLLTPIGGAAVMAMLLGVVSLRGVDALINRTAFETGVNILGDSVVPTRDYGVRSDSIGARFLDTLRIVEFMLQGASVRSASVIGDFNAWQRGATSLTPDANGRWRTRVLVPRDAVIYAYVVNDAQLVSAAPLTRHLSAPAAKRSTGDSI